MKWTVGWKYLPIDYGFPLGCLGKVTQRTIFKNNLNGNKIRLKISNKYGKDPLVLEKIIVAAKTFRDNNVENLKAITFKGNRKICIEPGVDFYSDEAEWNIEAGKDIVIFIYIEEETTIWSAASSCSSEIWKTQYKEADIEFCINREEIGWKDSCDTFSHIEPEKNIIIGVTEISIYTDNAAKSVMLFGDSITHMSYFSDALSLKITEKYPGTVALLNAGVSGNRMLRDSCNISDLPGGGRRFGKAGIKRIKYDVFNEEVPDYVLVLEGINDIMFPYLFNCSKESVRARDLTASVEYITEMAHKNGSHIYFGTILPFYNKLNQSWFAEAEAVRTVYNKWLRSYKEIDGVLDYDSTLADAVEPFRICNSMHIGDWLHPNEFGGKQMADVAFKVLDKEWK